MTASDISEISLAAAERFKEAFPRKTEKSRVHGCLMDLEDSDRSGSLPEDFDDTLLPSFTHNGKQGIGIRLLSISVFRP